MGFDKAIQDIFGVVKKVKWRDCEEDSRFQWYYAEENHYLISDKKTGAYWFIKAKSPSSAFESVKGRLCL